MKTSDIEHSFMLAMKNRRQPPSFFLYGKSLFSLERLALDITKTVEESHQMQFHGIVKHFSINMPYLGERNDAERFLKKIEESVSVARDCYSSFQGIIIVELSKEWIRNGMTSYFSVFTDYICTHRDISFVVIVETEKDDADVEFIRQALLGSTLWLELQMAENELVHCVKLFRSMARDLGLKVSEEADRVIPEMLEKADTSVMTLEQVVCQTLLQIELEKRAAEAEMVIGLDDLLLLPRGIQDKPKNIIGFTSTR